MKVACVQLAALDLAHAESSLQSALDSLDEAARAGADLIVLPECSYPAYFLRGAGEYARAGLRAWQETLDLFGAKARAHHCHLVVGLAQPAERGDCLSNLAVLFGPDGQVIGSTAKRFLWHFDRHWFAPGAEYEVCDTPIGRLGIVVCADGRLPEIARLLALRGAQVIIDPTAWVTGGGDRASLTNPQYEYLMPTRAIENGVWCVVANKVGLEADTVLYCGRSCVIDPLGNKLVAASTDREEIVYAEIDPSAAGGPPLPRRPELYAALARATTELPIAGLLLEPLVPDAAVVRIASCQLAARPSISSYLGRIEGLLETLSRQDVDLVVLPGDALWDSGGSAEGAAALSSSLAALSARFGCGLAATLCERDGERRYRTCFIWDRGKIAASYRKTHLDAQDLSKGQSDGLSAGEALPVFDTRFGRLGVMLDDEGLLPEVPRCLMLHGADTLVWPARSSLLPLQQLARSRADENKVHVILSIALGEGTAIVGPSGAPLAVALPDVDQAIAAQVASINARYKEMAPHTHVVYDRRPEDYGELTQRE